MAGTLYRPKDLMRFAAELFMKLGMPEQDAKVAADSLVRADLEGNESHGLSRLAIYAKRMGEGRIAAQPDIRIERAGSVLNVDGGNGLGQVVSHHALTAAIPLSKETGMMGVFVRGSNHFGTAAYYCQMACRENIALIAMTNSPPGIPPWGGKKAYFGTNPIAFGFPTRNEPPVIVDMSSSVVARGKIILADKVGGSIPLGWAMDEDGVETTDPAAALKGAVMPLGGAKGYALAMAIEIMCGVLSNAAFGPHVNNLYKDQDPPANVGHSFILLNIEQWMPLAHYYDRMEQFLQEIKGVPTAKGVDHILYPGERRYHTFQERMQQGIALSGEVRGELLNLAEKFGVMLPDSIN